MTNDTLPLTDIEPIDNEEESRPVFTFGGKPLTRGREKKPLKLFIYGHNGIGKTTFASQMDSPVLLDLEDNASHLRVDRQLLTNYRDVQSFLLALKTEEHSFKTVILDSVDVLEDLMTQDILTRSGKTDLSKVGAYGEGYKQQVAAFANIIKRMDALFQRGMNVVFLGHETISRVEEPGEKVYDRVTPAIREANYRQLCNWCFAVFYATSAVNRGAVEDTGFNQKRTGNVHRTSDRIFYTTPSAAHLAKNVFELSSPIPLDYPAFEKAIENFYHPSTEKEENE
jgi:hypothetical protein